MAELTGIVQGYSARLPSSDFTDYLTHSLCLAVTLGSGPKVLTFLLDKRVDASTQSAEGLTPLEIVKEKSCMKYTVNKHYDEVVKLLTKHTAEPHRAERQCAEIFVTMSVSRVFSNLPGLRADRYIKKAADVTYS